jgi:hypothetical protein
MNSDERCGSAGLRAAWPRGFLVAGGRYDCRVVGSWR